MTLDHADAQIEIAILASVERQANATAAALERVLKLMDATRRQGAGARQQAHDNKKTTTRRRSKDEKQH